MAGSDGCAHQPTGQRLPVRGAGDSTTGAALARTGGGVTLARLLEAPDADAYDLLANLAFNASLVSRDERAKAFLNRNQDFLGCFKGKAREILELLVDKYRVWGIEEIAKPEVFRVRPLSEYGTFTAIAELFKGPRNLKRAMDELQVRLYATA